MAAVITVPADEVWRYYQTNVAGWKASIHEIAREDDYGIRIYVTESRGKASILVTVDDVEFFEEDVVSEYDCTTTVNEVYEKFLTDEVISLLLDAKDEEDDYLNYANYEREELEGIIEDREEMLNDAVFGFLAVACDDYIDDGMYNPVEFDAVCEDIKEHMLEYISRKHGLPVRRPMFLEDENGEEFFEEYPYDCIVFDDADNPIYK